MTEERYNEIDNMGEEGLAGLTQEEYDEYLARRYDKLTDHDAAIDDLLGDINTAQQDGLPMWATGFCGLDGMLDGGFLAGNLVLLGAISSLGKTTFALQIAENVALSGKDVLVFSLEMSKKELFAKSISRNTYRLVEADKTEKPKRHYSAEADRLTLGDVLRGRIGLIGEPKRELFDRALAETNKLKEHLRIIRDNNITVDEVEAYVHAHELATKRKPLVILDYLQILKHGETLRGDKRLLTDDDVNRLKDLAVRVGIPIIVISSFNRNNYLEPANMGSFKESGTIEYSSDVLIAMQYSGMQYQKHWYKKKGAKKAKLVYESQLDHVTRVRELLDNMDELGALGNTLPVDVILLKNRGVSKGKLLFEFCPKYNVFKEKEDQSKAARKRYDMGEAVDENEDDATVSSVDSSSTLGNV